MRYIGIDIGGTKCAVVSSDGTEITDKVKFDTVNVRATLDKIFAETQKMGSADAIGISCGGPLDLDNGVILSPPNLPGWDNIEICKMMQERFGVPTAIQNDANACALAEWNFGAGRGTRNMVFLTFGTGMGAGLILNGQLYAGTNGMAGEIGHIRMSPFGPVGYGKSGSFEGFCSGGGIAETGRMVAREQLQLGKKPSFCSSYEELNQITAKKIAEFAKAGDDMAQHVYDICAEKLGAGLSVLIDLLNPECIVIGSVFARSAELLRTRMEEVVRMETLPHTGSVCRIVPAQLGDEIGDYAAISVAMEAKKRGMKWKN